MKSRKITIPVMLRDEKLSISREKNDPESSLPDEMKRKTNGLGRN